MGEQRRPSDMAARAFAGSSRALLQPRTSTSSSSLRVWRSLSTSAKARAAAAAATQADGAAAPPPAAAGASSSSSNAQVNKIVDDISKLTLLEAADLVETLKSRLNIADVPVAAAPAAEEAAAPKEKTAFDVTLKKIDASAKAKVIKEVKTVMPSMNLVEAKKFVESLPKVLKEGATKEEAEKLKKALEAVGA